VHVSILTWGYSKVHNSHTRCSQTLEDILRARKLPTKLLEYSDVEPCPGLMEPQQLEAIPEQVPVAMVIGSQKAGTTYLFEALHKHASFVSPVRLLGYASDAQHVIFEGNDVIWNGLERDTLRPE
jgi:hypothetical protein